MAPCILNRGITRRRPVNFKSRSLYSWGGSLRFTIGSRLGEPQRQYGRCKEKNLLSSGIRTPIPWMQSSSIIAIPTEPFNILTLTYILNKKRSDLIGLTMPVIFCEKIILCQWQWTSRNYNDCDAQTGLTESYCIKPAARNAICFTTVGP
jgi:hypothetical protein